MPRGKLSGSDQKPPETAFLADSKELIRELGMGLFNKLHKQLALHFSRSYSLTAHGRLSRGTGLNVFLKSRKYYLGCFPLTLLPDLQPTALSRKETRLSKTVIVNQFWFGCFLPSYYSPRVYKLKLHFQQQEDNNTTQSFVNLQYDVE